MSKMKSKLVLALVLPLGMTMAPAIASSAQAEWGVVGELDSPVASGVVITLSGARALLTGSDGRDASRVDLYQPAIGFVRVADSPGPLDLHFGAKLPDGRVLVGGGAVGSFLDRSNLTDHCYIYDPATDSWSEAAPLPSPSFYLYGNTAVTLPDGRVMVTGGSTPAEAYFDSGIGDVYLASRNVFLFDPDGLTVLPDGRVLLVGGREYNPGSFHGVSPIDAYDPLTDTWTRLAEMPGVPSDGDASYGGRGFPGVTLLESGELLIFGGLATRFVELGSQQGRVTCVSNGPPLPRKSSLLFDPVTNQFQRAGDLNVRRSRPLAVAWPQGGGVLSIGGTSVLFSEPVPEAEVYDTSAQAWFLLPVEPEAAYDFSRRKGAALTDGTVLTWSALPYWEEPAWGGVGGMRSVKRLHLSD